MVSYASDGTMLHTIRVCQHTHIIFMTGQSEMCFPMNKLVLKKCWLLSVAKSPTDEFLAERL